MKIYAYVNKYEVVQIPNYNDQKMINKNINQKAIGNVIDYMLCSQ